MKQDMLLAPNGKKSNLTPEQYKLVRTPAFKTWFGDWEKLESVKVNDPAMDEITLQNLSKDVSKVVDENGEPLVLWHFAKRLDAQSERFNIFRVDRQLGSHFGSINQVKYLKYLSFNNTSVLLHPNIENKETDFRFYQVFLKIVKPVRLQDVGIFEATTLLSALNPEVASNMYKGKYKDNVDFALLDNMLDKVKYLAKNVSGYDGAIYLNRYEATDDIYILNKYDDSSDQVFKSVVPNAEDSWIAFQPEQIKLADGSNLTFDGSNPDIRYAKGGNIETALNDLDRAPSVKYWMQPEFRAETWEYEKKGKPNSFVKLFDEKNNADTILAYDNTGNLVGIFTIAKEGKEKGAFKIVVREDSVNKGWGKKLLDEAEKKGIDVVGNVKRNSFTSSGRDLLRSWLTKKMEKGGELALGIKAEMEHRQTIDKFKRAGVSEKDVATSIAKDHLKEDPQYYTKLMKMESKMATGGNVEDQIQANIRERDSYLEVVDKLNLIHKRKYANRDIESPKSEEEKESEAEMRKLLRQATDLNDINRKLRQSLKMSTGGLIDNYHIESIFDAIKDEIPADWIGDEAREVAVGNAIWKAINSAESKNFIDDSINKQQLQRKLYAEYFRKEREKDYAYDLDSAKKYEATINLDTELFKQKFSLTDLYFDEFLRVSMKFKNEDRVALDLTLNLRKLEYFRPSKGDTYNRVEDIQYWLRNASQYLQDKPELIIANLQTTNKQWTSKPKGFVKQETMKQNETIMPVKTEPYHGISATVSDYKNPYEINRAVEKLLDIKGVERESYTPDEINFLSAYSGYGGLQDMGTLSDEELQGIFYEFYTPDEVVKKMWGLAYKYGYGAIGDNSVFEPSVGIGAFLKYAPENVDVAANEINRYSAMICHILYPNARTTLMPFEKNFIKQNLSIKGKVENLKKYSLVIGNPPYGSLSGIYIPMGEDKYTNAANWVEYFILRGLDILQQDGLLIYIVGAEQYNGGTMFLDSPLTKAKKAIFEKADLIDAYRLPNKIFERTGVSSEIVIFKKR